MQVVYNANKLAKLVNKKEKMQNWLDYYQIKYSRNQSSRPFMKVNGCLLKAVVYLLLSLNKLYPISYS